MFWLMAVSFAAEPTTCEGWESDLESMAKRLGEHAAGVLGKGSVEKFECDAAKTECWTWTTENWKIRVTFTPGSGAASGVANNSSGDSGKRIEGMTYECDTDGNLKVLGGRVVSE
jgi:hypothetical protein